MARLVLLRHGESQWNLENRFTGWVDVPLSSRGIQEAKNAGEKLRRCPEVCETRTSKRPREEWEIGARGDVPIRPDPHVVRARRAPAGPSGVGPDRGRPRPEAISRFGIRRGWAGSGTRLP